MSFENLGKAIALFDYRGSTDEELNFYEGDIFILLDESHPEWTFAQFCNDSNLRGYVPKSYIKVINDSEASEIESSRSSMVDAYESEQDSEAGESRDDNDDDYQQFEPTPPHQFPVQFSTSRKSAADLAEEEELRAANISRRQKLLKNLAPRSSVAGQTTPAISPKASLPAGHIPSFLGSQFTELDKRLSYCLFPQFDESGLGFQDLFFEQKKQRVRRRCAKSVVAFSVMEAKNIVPFSLIPGYELIEQSVRMALFDKRSILSNIHSIEATINSSTQDTKWRFSNKASLLFPKDDENTCFVRTNDIDINLTLLFEIVVLVKKTGAKALSAVELSAGWGVLPMYTADGGPIENRTYNIRLYPGCPFDKGNSFINSAESKGFFASIFGGSNNPSLEIRVWKLGKSVLNEIKFVFITLMVSQLPDTCMSFLSVVPLLATYRNILANTLYSPQLEGKNYALSEPALALLPQIVDSNHLLQLVSNIWDKKLKLMKRSEKRSFLIMKQRFTESVLVVWPLLYHNSSAQNNINKEAFTLAAVEQLQMDGALSILTHNADNSYFAPFHANEIQFIYGYYMRNGRV